MRTLDCLIIGHNATETSTVYAQLRMLGKQSGSYRDFNLGFISADGQKLSLTEVHNLLVEYPAKRIREFNTFNAAISYLGTFLHKHNMSFDYITSVREEKERLKEILSNDIVLSAAVLTTLYVTPDPIVEVAEMIRDISPSTKIIIGGPYITTLCRTKDEDYIRYVCSELIKADYYVNSSKGENTLINLVNAIKSQGDVSDIKNLFYIKDGGLVINEVMPETQSLSENMVDWKLFEMDAKEFVNVRTAVSCPYACAFCGFPENAGKYQTTDVRLVEEELNGLAKHNHNLRSIYFIDDTFNVPPSRFKELLRVIIKQKYNFRWHSYLRCQHLDEETVNLLSDSGCEGVFLGIESGSNNILKNMNKQASVDLYNKGIELLKKRGIMTFGAFIIGFPGENLKSIMETMRFIENSGLDFFRAQMWFCEHISPIWRQRNSYNIIGEGFNWSHATMDSNIASLFVEKLFLDIKYVTWLPQYDFDYENVFRLLHNGMTLDQVTLLVSTFNDCIKNKLRNPTDLDISDENFDRLKVIIRNSYRKEFASRAYSQSMK